MIAPKDFHSLLQAKGIEFFCGVPDSLLKHFCMYLDGLGTSNQHIITANEGSALSLAAGYYMSTGKLPVVYLQNSGLGNLINPLLSLCEPRVYGLPAILLIGWRGETDAAGHQLKDEPQHIAQGMLTPALLETMHIPYVIISAEDTDSDQKLAPLIALAKNEEKPVAVLVRKNTFAKPDLVGAASGGPQESLMGREEAIEHIMRSIQPASPIVSTTGMISRELFELRKKWHLSGESDFLTVGSMGHASQIALGICITKPNVSVYCLDGDGAVIMHMGNLSNCADAKNLRHIVLNNGCHDSVGGQPTQANKIQLTAIAKACGYAYTECVTTQAELKNALSAAEKTDGAVFIEVKVKKGSRSDLGRPTASPQESKKLFMAALSKH